MIHKIAEQTLDSVIAEYVNAPVDIFGNGGGPAETEAITSLMYLSYQRTVNDIYTLYSGRLQADEKVRILEVGPWLGVVAVTLKRLGFDVVVQEIPEFVANPNFQRKFVSENIPITVNNLSDYALPHEDGSYDCVILCEVLEHLNFNPLPVLDEINRILKQEGKFYVSLPNLAFLPKRIGFLFGKSVHDPIAYFFNQLRPGTSAVVCIHWREYTGDELKTLLMKMGFEVEMHYYFHNAGRRAGNILRRRLLDFIYGKFPAFLPNQTAIASKVVKLDHKFVISDVVR